MKISLINILRVSLLENDNHKAFIPEDVFVFKQLNKIMKSAKTKENILLELKKLLDLMSLSQDDALYYYYTWVLNYRENGDYDSITNAQKVGLETLKKTKSTVGGSGTYVRSKIPFKASNLEGFWEKDVNNVDQYVVVSYNWYPIILYKDGRWYVVSDSYSRSTSRHIGSGLPHTQKITRLTPDELRLLRLGKNVDELKTKKVSNLVSKFNQYIGKDFFSHMYVSYWVNPEAVPVVGPRNKFRVKFTLKSIDVDGLNIILNVKIDSLDIISYSGKIVSRNFDPNTRIGNETILDILNKNSYLEREILMSIVRKSNLSREIMSKDNIKLNLL